MAENKNKKRRGVSIEKPADVRRIAREIIADCFRDQAQIEQAGKINNLLITWLKAWELEHVSDIEKRLAALEKLKAGGKA
jgi:hypothetical protein